MFKIYAALVVRGVSTGPRKRIHTFGWVKFWKKPKERSFEISFIVLVIWSGSHLDARSVTKAKSGLYMFRHVD